MKRSDVYKSKFDKTKKIWVLSFLLIVSLLSNIGLFIVTRHKEEVEIEKPISEEIITVTSKAAPIPYQNLYPNLHADDLTFKFVAKQKKTVYLTFDDGPSKITPHLLDILKRSGVKATFFVLYSETEEGKAMYKRIVDEGHSIGIHSTTHDYEAIYQSVETFLADFEKTHRQIKAVTGVNTRLFRFPGGSVNAYNMSNYQEITAEMIRRGFIYYDWNVDSRDTSRNPNSDIVVSAVTHGVSGKTEANVLMHDAGAKSFNIDALPKIIKALQVSGYDMLPLDATIQPQHFNYSNE